MQKYREVTTDNAEIQGNEKIRFKSLYYTKRHNKLRDSPVVLSEKELIKIPEMIC